MHLQFDRGTILVNDVPPGLGLTDAPGLLWDARVQAHRAPAFMYPILTQWLLDRGVQFIDTARVDHEPTKGWADPGLREYQAAALWAWELAGRRGVVVLPTGSGKTRVALAAMASTHLPALCLVPTRVLLEQWRREIATVYPHQVGCYGEGRREVAPVTVATYESGYRHMDRVGHRFGLLVVDEVHHFGCGFRDEAQVRGGGAARGATAPRGTRARRRAAVAPFCRPLADRCQFRRSAPRRPV